MEREKLARLLVIPLALILLGLWWSRLQPPRSIVSPKTMATPAPMPASPTPPAPAAPAVATTDGTSDTGPLTLPARDPFQPPEALLNILKPPASATGTPGPSGEPTMPSLKLQGIFWGTPPPRGIINDQIVTEGDTVSGVRIVKIESRGITVEFQGVQSVLQLPKPGAPHEPVKSRP